MNKSPLVLCLDGYNLMHRARSGFTLGDHAIVYNFFRSLKSLVEQHKPTRVIFTLEGRAERQLQRLLSYKANRAITYDANKELDNQTFIKKTRELIKFNQQKRIIIDLLSKYFPISVVKHENFEADDTIYNLIKSGSTAIPWIVVSSDTDFIQLLQEFNHVKVYDAIKKQFMSPPDYPYVVWKALRGDSSDNIPGIPGVGDKTAEELARHKDKLEMFLSNLSASCGNEDNLCQPNTRVGVFNRNLDLISFKQWSTDEAMKMTSSEPVCDWNIIKSTFESFEFKSMIKENYWSKFVETFDKLC